MLQETFPEGGVALRPGFMHGTRMVGGVGVPLGAVGKPPLFSQTPFAAKAAKLT